MVVANNFNRSASRYSPQILAIAQEIIRSDMDTRYGNIRIPYHSHVSVEVSYQMLYYPEATDRAQIIIREDAIRAAHHVYDKLRRVMNGAELPKELIPEYP